jgi:ATP-binding cassette subfamily B protein
MSELIKLKKELFNFIKPYLSSIIVAIILLLIVSSLALIGPIIIKRLIDVDIANGLYEGIWVSAAMYIAVKLAMLAGNYFQMYTLQRVGVSIMCDIKLKLFSHILRLPLKYFEKNPAGKLISRIESDTETLRQLFTNTVMTLFQDLLMFAGMVAVMFYLSAKLTLIVLLILPFLFAGAFYIQRELRVRFKIAREKASAVSKFLSEYIQGMQCVQAFNYEQTSKNKMGEHNEEKKGTFYFAEVLEIIFHNSILLAEAMTLSAVLYFGGAMALSKELTIGTLVLFIGYIRQCFEPIIRLSEQFNIIQKARVAAERIFEILSLEPEERSIDETAASSETAASFRDRIEFDNVSFSYDGGREVLSGVSFSVRKGEKVALVGHTGSGKTTILSLLLRFYNHTGGRITIDGMEVNAMKLSELRKKFALVLQDVVLFPGCVMDNIRLLDESISGEEVEKAAQSVNMLDFIMKKEKGFQTEVAERGSNFSMGERQLLSFARALAFNSEILVLDEATSSVDPYTEALIQDALTKIQAGRTSIIVAHRLSTIINSDRIIVLEAGRIVETGSHEELLALNGHYRKLYEKQRAGVEPPAETKEVSDGGFEESQEQPDAVAVMAGGFSQIETINEDADGGLKNASAE